ncbi:hypothetical protein B0H11DRAFT_2001334 [Mycena galericulata]|nr:hypothetical protein B0H11DRAFT_2001334 [Mycena galericulata]
MSPETPNVFHTSFLRKSLAAVSKIGHPNPPYTPKRDGSTSRPTLQSHRIFNLHLSRLNTSSPPRLGPKVRSTPLKPANIRDLVDTEGSTLLDDDSMYNEVSPEVFRAPPKSYRNDRKFLPPMNRLDVDNNAARLPPSLANSKVPPRARIPPPPGLRPPSPPRYPLIIPTKKNPVPQGAALPPHWAPGGGCNVRIEPEPSMGFLPRPGTNPPPFWNPGGRATRIDKPLRVSVPAPLPTSHSNGSSASYEGDVSLGQDTTGTVTNSDSSASLDQAVKKDKDHIQAQLENIFQMDDDVLRDADLPGVYESMWATCPTPPPSPASLSASRLTRKQSHALLNYLLLECGYDLGSLRRLTARFPVPKTEPEGAPRVDQGCAPDATELGNQSALDEPQISNKEAVVKSSIGMTPQTLDPWEKTDESVTLAVLESMVETLGAALPTPDTACVEECNGVEVLVTDSKVSVLSKYPDPPHCSLPLVRTRSLPEGWTISQFTVFDKPSLPPSPTPAPKHKPKMYQHVIESAESVAAPLQSGRAYLQSINIGKKQKHKTRPVAATIKPEPVVPLTRTTTGTSFHPKTSLLSIFRRRDNTRGEEPKAEQKPAGKWLGKLSNLPKATADHMRVLFKGGAGAGNARELSWTEFIGVMKNLGFQWESAGGNAFKFYLPDSSAPVRGWSFYKIS